VQRGWLSGARAIGDGTGPTKMPQVTVVPVWCATAAQPESVTVTTSTVTPVEGV